MEIVCLFFPSLVGILIYEKINKKKLKVFDSIKYYSLLTILNNIIIYSILYYINNTNIIDYSVIFCLKYLVFSFVIQILLSFIITIIEKRLEIIIRVEKNNK